jgi:Tfp pilus assembly protein PilF
VRRIPPIAIAAALVAIIFAVASNARTRVWHDSISLWTSVIDYTGQSRLAFNSRAVALAEIGRIAEARRDFDRALAVDPCYGQALRNRAILSVREGNLAAADADLGRWMECDPSTAVPRQMRERLRR